MIVVDGLDEWLNFAALGLAFLRHAPGDFQGISLDAGDERMREWVRFGTSVKRLNDDDLKDHLVAVAEFAPQETKDKSS